MSKWKVYISSTFRDLKDFRKELINLFQNQLKNNFELCEIMERMFDDGTYTPYIEDCVEAVLESDIYIIILGNKIGSFPPDEQRTYTEIEIDTALSNDKKIFCLHLEEFDEAEIDNKNKHKELLAKFKGRPSHTFMDAKDLRSALYEFLIQFTSESPVNTKNPYKGLASFDVDDGDYFFGRNAEIESCIKKIVMSGGNFFVSVIGNSGTGKSSFVKAGIMFRLEHKKEYGFSERSQIIVTPTSEPFTNLKYQMQLQGISVDDVLNLNSESSDLILFFDQFEEVITQCHSPEALEERKHLFEFLDALTGNQNTKSRVLVICAFRSDFLSQLTNFDFIKSHQYLFPISSLDYKVHTDNWKQSMTKIITKPALKNGVVIENELVEQMLEQIKEVDGSLPILQFTLERIWNKETIADRRISSTEFNKLSEGKGISGIIETHAENVIKDITNNGRNKEREAILKTIFVNLVEVNENLNDIKRTVSKDELFSKLKQHPQQVVKIVFETLVSEKSRLLNISQEKDESINVGIIHEELIRKWGRLKSWIDERREALETGKRITLNITAYKKGEEDLYSRKQVKRAKQWQMNNPDLASEEIDSFLLNSQRKNNKALYEGSGMVILTAILITIVILAWVQPAIQERDFLDIIEKNHPNLSRKIQEVGVLDSLRVLTINSTNYSALNGNLKFFGNLKSLIVDGNGVAMQQLSIVENIKNPTSLDSLTIYNNEALTGLAGIEKLTALNSLKIGNNEALTSLAGIENLTALNSLMIYHNEALTSLEGIEKLTALNSLDIYDNEALTSLEGIEKLTSLNSLTIANNNSLTSLAGVEKLTDLSSLTISKNNSLTILAGIENLTALNSLKIYQNDSLSALEGIEKLTALNSLGISHIDVLTSLAGIEKLTALDSLIIYNNDSLTSLASIEKLTAINSLTISRLSALTSLSSLENLTALNSLEIYNNEALTSLAGIENLTALNSLVIWGNGALISLEGIENLTALNSLEIYSNDGLTSLAGVENLIALNSLEIYGNGALTSLEGIENLTALNSLHIYGNGALTSLEGIENLTAITSLTISNNASLTSLAGIQNLTALNSLEIANNGALTPQDGIELYRLTNLDKLIVNKTIVPEIDKIKQNNPGIEIVFR
ncbi:Leucine-rich repeat (LRR) protein [Pricia antarctica]|uniref:Leucine-rich repeat (LRR) protein n=1 Tax=Pricia antarctica TaxID=641691 RepID=A0A1G6XB66_9FLAO|nr:DUF4062 domain-containing protein [Pricia antarctica]SDD75043.1 Leucine-rich repeat (LRR) protein [Pricia antarctica]